MDSGRVVFHRFFPKKDSGWCALLRGVPSVVMNYITDSDEKINGLFEPGNLDEKTMWY